MSGDNLREILRQCKKYYHNSQDWHDDSWEDGVSCNTLIENEIITIENNLNKVRSENSELRNDLSDEIFKHAKLQFAYDMLSDKFLRLEEQIADMKCFANCKHSSVDYDGEAYCKKCIHGSCKVCILWELMV